MVFIFTHFFFSFLFIEKKGERVPRDDAATLIKFICCY